MKKDIKKISSILLVAVIASLASCGNGGQGGSSNSENTEDAPVVGRNVVDTAWKLPNKGWQDKEVTINFYSTMGQNLVPIVDDYIEEFNELYPSITVVHTQPGGYDQVRDQIKTELSTGNGPDLAYCYPDHVALYNKTRTVVTLDNLIVDPQIGLTQAQEDDFVEGYYEEGRQFGDGLMYTLPFSKSTEVLYYDATYFADHNIKVPNHWFSTSDTDDTSMEYVCKQLKQLDPDCTPLGYDSEANWFITMTEQMKSPYTSATGNHFLFNNDANKEFVTKIKAWREKGYVTTQTIHGGYTSGLFTATDGNRSYMSIGSSAGATKQRPTKVDGKYPFEVGIAPIPQHDENNKKAISQGPSICLFNHGNADKVMASWLLLKYLTTTVELQAQFSMDSGYVPVIKSVKDNPIYAQFLAEADGGDNVAALSANVCTDAMDTYFTSPAFIGSSAARDQVGALLTQALELGLSHDSAEFTAQLDKMFADAVVECEYNS